jgi:MoaA/NifB/PqqE/SkfB family radical SAM enzyme
MEETMMTMVRFPMPQSQHRTFGGSPLQVFYEVTQTCDMVGNHGRAGAQSGTPSAELTTGQSLRLIDQLTEFPVSPKLVLTGGDPFKRADVFELVQHAARRSLDVSITSSAMSLVTPSALRRLRGAGVSRIAVSIDGADARTHDAVRGVGGSYYQSFQILADARSEGIPTQVNTTITRENVEQIARMAELFARVRISAWSVFFPVSVNRASHASHLSAAEYESAFERLYDQSRRQSYSVTTNDAPQYRRYLIQRRVQKLSGKAGRTTSSYVPLHVNNSKGVMFVSHVGLVYPSASMPILCGIYPLQHLVRIYQASPVFRKLRDTDNLQGKCGFCEYRHICGGSRARAHAATGNPLAEDPDCAYVPEGCTAA